MSKVNEAMAPTELSEDIEVIGPGHMLAQGRIALGLSQKEVAEKLNFRLSLVENIENDQFDKTLPATFNRGYLRCFAKLVAVPEDEVLASYEMLGVAEKQCAEMQSFSKITTKQAEHSRLMWVSYFILAAIIASTLVWFFQDNKAALTVSSLINNQSSETTPVEDGSKMPADVTKSLAPLSAETVTHSSSEQVAFEQATTELASLPNEQQAQQSLQSTNENTLIPENSLAPESHATQTANGYTVTSTTDVNENNLATEVNEIPVSFVFSGDCWVNIYDATGERIAWGVKKADYVMNIKGVAPFSITLGKPELVTINYHGSDVDMSQFTRGNIAKFTLPLTNN